jgi:hypothetical protein
MGSAHADTPAVPASAGWEAAMDQGRAALAGRDFASAYRHFGRAHGLGHNDLARHLSAHACLAAAARSERRPGRTVQYLLQLVGAALFDRDHSRDGCAVCRAADTAGA